MITLMNQNIARYLPQMARERPEQLAVVMGGKRDKAGKVAYERLSFAELDRDSDRYAWGLSAFGIGAGSRVLLMVRPGLPLICLTFALFKVGCVPVLIDPAMGRRNLAQCIEECAPDALIGVPRAFLARMVFAKAFRSVKRAVVVGGVLMPGADVRLSELRAEISAPFPLEPVAADTLAAILFTTGSTGVPKGVCYTHGMFEAQVRVLRELYSIAPGEVEMPAFPLFALFNVALGTTSAIPPIDPTRPASCDPAAVVEFINDQQVTSTFGSPAIWANVTRYCLDKEITLPSLRRVLMAGAPVPAALHERFLKILPPEASTHTPYGATEALPISSISGREVLAAHAERGEPTAGTCVGRAVPGVALQVIAISDEPIASWGEAQVLPPYQVGEIVVKGPAVTTSYVNRPRSTELAKIAEGQQIWHRMGDLGYLDEQGRLWFYGRKSQRVETADGPLYTEPVELIFNQHAHVARSALVGVQTKDERRKTKERAGQPKSATLPDLRLSSSALRPVVVIEPRPGHMPKTAAQRESFIAELRELAARYPMSERLTSFLFHPSFPVDIRHNAKIFREQLAAWAARS
jgi:olefin beta-lactone synthetase